MKKFLIPLFLFSVVFLLSAAPPILRQFGTTNTPTVLTNIIQSLAGGGVQVWTNDGSFTWLSGLPTPDPTGNSPGPPFFFSRDGSLYMGTNVTQDINVNDYSYSRPIYHISMTDSNEPSKFLVQLEACDSEEFNYYSYIVMSGLANNPNNTITDINLDSLDTDGRESVVDIVANSGNGASIFLSESNVTAISIGPRGVISAIGNISSSGTYHGNGSGLTNLVLSVSGTNATPPSDAATIKAWLNVTLPDGAVYKSPLYQ